MNVHLPFVGALNGVEDVLIPIFAMVCVFVVPAIAARRRESGFSDEEVRLMQEIHRSLARMDQRIEALETLTMGSGSRSATHRAGTDSREDTRNDDQL